MDELQDEVEKLLVLLLDPHPGLYTWRQMLRTRMERLRTVLTALLDTP